MVYITESIEWLYYVFCNYLYILFTDAYSVRDLVLTINPEDLEATDNLRVSKFDIRKVEVGNMNLSYAIGKLCGLKLKLLWKKIMESKVVGFFQWVWHLHHLLCNTILYNI